MKPLMSPTARPHKRRIFIPTTTVDCLCASAATEAAAATPVAAPSRFCPCTHPANQRPAAVLLKPFGDLLGASLFSVVCASSSCPSLFLLFDAKDRLGAATKRGHPSGFKNLSVAFADGLADTTPT